MTAKVSLARRCLLQLRPFTARATTSYARIFRRVAPSSKMLWKRILLSASRYCALF